MSRVLRPGARGGGRGAADPDHPTFRGLDAGREARARGALETIPKPSAWPAGTSDQERLGRDGARGLLRLREAGGVTLVQDEVTSSSFGMPRTALGLDAARMTVARQDLAGVLVHLVSRRGRAGA